MKRLPFALIGLLCAAPAAAQPAAAPAMVAPAARPPGYLAGKPPLDVLRLLPPPPAAGSPEDRADRLVYKDSKRAVGGVLWQRAIGQLSVTSPAFVQQLSCAFGAALSPEATPATMRLLARAGSDLAPAVSQAKAHYNRPRPFTTDRGKACDPDAADGKGEKLGAAFPSGHAAVGWLWGLILSDVRPERSATLLHFGKETGDLRLACRVHWLSDVTHGRLFATALYQRIADQDAYKADLDAARTEVALAPVPQGCPAAAGK
jgi:acid phosphatase (class A)